MDLHRLSLPFPRAAIHWRIQGKPFERNGTHSAMALAYLDARDVMDRLDDVCGPDRWQSHFEETAKGRVICKLSIDVSGNGDWVTKSDGAGDTDVEGEKGGISDALKRAAVSWGIGRYLYRLESPWVACEINAKGFWKGWAEDPWSKVKNAPQEATPSEVYEAVSSIIAAPDLPALGAWWTGFYRNAQHVAQNPVVYAAKEARKAALTQQKEAA